MKFGRIGITRPEQFPKLFNVYSQDTDTSDKGRERLQAPVYVCSVRSILSTAKPEEQRRFEQMGVLITHTILQRGTPVAAENNILALEKGGVETRRFRVQAVQNKGEMGIDTLYFCEERGDLK